MKIFAEPKDNQQCMPPQGGECYQMQFIEPTFEEYEQEVTVRPAWTEYVSIPPVWEETVETIQCSEQGYWELVKCNGEDQVCWNSDTQTAEVTVYTLVEEGRCETIEHPEETQTVLCTRVTAPGHFEWVEADCK